MKLCANRSAHVLAWILVSAVPALAAASDWARFRGPNGTGISGDDKATPIQWSETQNLKWKVDLPGPGSSSPIVVGDRVFVTCWTGYGMDDGNPGDQENLERLLLCIDRGTGNTVWAKAVDAVLPEDRYQGMFTQHGYASHTPVSDGRRVYAFFGKSGVVAFDLEGNQLWRTSVGTGLDPRGWGSASSPILYKNLVIVIASAESESLVALHKDTGAEVWRAEAGGLAGTWSTPILVEVGDGRVDLVLAVPYEIWGMNPETGKLRWYCESLDSNSMCASPIAHEGIVYVMGGLNGGAVAVRAGGKGDVTQTHVLWNNRERGRISTPIYHEGRLHWFSGGVANCIDAKTGERLYQSRPARAGTTAEGSASGGAAGASAPPRRFGPPPGGFGRGGGMFAMDYSSPVAANGKLYFVSRSGEMFVLKLGPEFEQIGYNRFASDDGDYSATPAVSNGELFIRSSNRLYCVTAAQ